MSRIQYTDDVNGNFQEARGSDGRLNVSARSDARAYYNSRDKGQCYTVPFSHPTAGDGEYSAYWKNTSPNKTLVISSIGVNSDDIARFKLWFVSGTAANGTAFTPTNLNKTSANDAEATALTDGGGTAISGLTEDGLIDDLRVSANGHEEFRLSDRIRLGQNDAIAIEMDAGTSTPDVNGVIFAYYE